MSCAPEVSSFSCHVAWKRKDLEPGHGLRICVRPFHAKRLGPAIPFDSAVAVPSRYITVTENGHVKSRCSGGGDEMERLNGRNGASSNSQVRSNRNRQHNKHS